MSVRPSPSFWLRWSGRDLRARKLQVGAIALIIGLGSGVYSGLSSTSAWRRASYDASYARTHMYDLHAALSTGSSVDAGALVDAIRSIPHAAGLDHVEARLVLPTQVDASRAGRTILVPGRIVGVDVTNGGPHVSRIDAVRGRGLSARDAGARVGVLDYHFADHYSLPARGHVLLSGDRRLEYVGLGLSPEYFMITGEQGGFLAEGNYAVSFVPLETAQALAGLPGAANDAVLTVRPGVDVAMVQREVRNALAKRLPQIGVTLNRKSADPVYRLLYDDIKGDQRFYNIFALLILAGAAFAAFNLIGRVVEAQRREIGIGMALGVPGRELAIRPALVGVEIAVLGVVLGVGVGLLVSAAMASLLSGFLPMPVWLYPFQLGVYARGVALGLVLPAAAALIPVWRAVRVSPIDAIRTNTLKVGRGRLLTTLARAPLPGRSTALMPFRNVLRAPRRTMLTALGVAAAIAVLVGVVGMVDSFFATIDGVDDEVLRTSPDRLTVELSTFYPQDSAPVRAIAAAAVVGSIEPHLRLGGTLRRGTTSIPVFLQAVEFGSPIWRPSIDDPHPAAGPGIVIAAKAADDLGVEPGDRVLLRYPKRAGTSYRYVTSRVPVVGLTRLPVRFTAFMDMQDATALTGLEGLTNTVIVVPKPGVSAARVERALFGLPGVGSVQPVSTFTTSVRNELGQTLDFLTIVEGAVLLLALLIAFNSSSINADERARENATMFAFGLPLRSVLRMDSIESLIIGLIGTGIGLLSGWLLLGWLINTLLPQTFPDIGLVATVSTSTLLTALVLGVVAVAVAPIFTARKLRRMDIPSTLRVVE